MKLQLVSNEKAKTYFLKLLWQYFVQFVPCNPAPLPHLCSDKPASDSNPNKGGKLGGQPAENNHTKVKL